MGRVLSTFPGAEARVQSGRSYVIRHDAYGTFVGLVLWVEPGWFKVRVIEPNGKMLGCFVNKRDELELSAAFCTFREVG